MDMHCQSTSLAPLNGVFPQMLWLHDNKIGDAGILTLTEALNSGILPNLGTLSLDHNQIGVSGVKALVGCISAGALPKCKSILLSDNKASKASIRSVGDALKKRLPS